jgi:hypothetical protein
MVIIYLYERTRFKKLAEKMGHNSGGVSPVAWDLSGNHKPMGKG